MGWISKVLDRSLIKWKKKKHTAILQLPWGMVQKYKCVVCWQKSFYCIYENWSHSSISSSDSWQKCNIRFHVWCIKIDLIKVPVGSERISKTLCLTLATIFFIILLIYIADVWQIYERFDISDSFVTDTISVFYQSWHSFTNSLSDV